MCSPASRTKLDAIALSDTVSVIDGATNSVAATRGVVPMRVSASANTPVEHVTRSRPTFIEPIPELLPTSPTGMCQAFETTGFGI
jgi:hypothetical protein